MYTFLPSYALTEKTYIYITLDLMHLDLESQILLTAYSHIQNPQAIAQPSTHQDTSQQPQFQPITSPSPPLPSPHLTSPHLTSPHLTPPEPLPSKIRNSIHTILHFMYTYLVDQKR